MAAVLGASFKAGLMASLAQCWWQGCPCLGPYNQTRLFFRFMHFPPSAVTAARAVRAVIGTGLRGACGAQSLAGDGAMGLFTLLGASQGVTPHSIHANTALLPPQLKSSDFVVLKRLVPLLEELSHTYPEPLTQELASDLCIAICTHGACSPGTVGAAADGVLGRKAGVGAQSPAGVPGTAPSPSSPRHGHGNPSAHRARSKEQSTCCEPSASSASAAPCADSLAPAGLQELLVSAYDPQPPARAAALRRLTSLVTLRDPEALRIQEKLLEVPGSCCGSCPLI